jgi:hypothetical protein
MRIALWIAAGVAAVCCAVLVGAATLITLGSVL